MKNKRIAIITAAGKGIRLNKTKKKQYIQLKGKPLLYYALDTFNGADIIDEIILVSDEANLNYVKSNIVDKFKLDKVRHIVVGGETRAKSVYNGFKYIEEKESVLIIHDGVRPFIKESTIVNIIKVGEKHGSAILGIRSSDTIKEVKEGLVKKTIKRESLWQIQTPQVFKYKILDEAYKNIDLENENITDEAYIVEQNNQAIRVVEGYKNNIKITTQYDLDFARYLLEVRDDEDRDRI